MNDVNLYRIAVVGTKRPNRKYVSTDQNSSIEFVSRIDALHWKRREALILTRAFNRELRTSGQKCVLQIELAS